MEIRELSDFEKALTASCLVIGKPFTKNRMAELLVLPIAVIDEIAKNLKYYLEIYERLLAKLPVNPRARKLSSLSVMMIRDMWASGNYSQKELMKFGGISRNTLVKTVNHRYWKDIPPTPNEIKRGWVR